MVGPSGRYRRVQYHELVFFALGLSTADKMCLGLQMGTEDGDWGTEDGGMGRGQRRWGRGGGGYLDMA